MGAAAGVKMRVEAALAGRIPGALTPAARTIREVVGTGIAELDSMLEGGLPVGAVTEFVGTASSGRTTAALAFCAKVVGEGKVCAWVDVEDTLCPASAAANGIALGRMLWVRCGPGDGRLGECGWGGGLRDGQATGKGGWRDEREGSKRLSGAGGGVKDRDAVLGGGESLGSWRVPGGSGGGGHPRDEVKGLEGAIESLLQSPRFARDGGKAGTPGALNRTIWPDGDRRVAAACAEGTTGGRRSGKDAYGRTSGGVIPRRPMGVGVGAGVGAGFGPVVRQEQVNSDRAPKRRGDFLLAEREAMGASVAAARADGDSGVRTAGQGGRGGQKPWGRLDQALRATDLLLQAGGFGAIVLDLGGVGVEFADRIPLATWFRFRTAADHSRTSLVVLTQRADGKSCAGSSAGLVVRFEGMEAVGVGAAHATFAGGGIAGETFAGETVPGGTVLGGMRFAAASARQRFGAAGPVSIAAGRRPPRATWECAAEWARPGEVGA